MRYTVFALFSLLNLPALVHSLCAEYPEHDIVVTASMNAHYIRQPDTVKSLNRVVLHAGKYGCGELNVLSMDRFGGRENGDWCNHRDVHCVNGNITLVGGKPEPRNCKTKPGEEWMEICEQWRSEVYEDCQHSQKWAGGVHVGDWENEHQEFAYKHQEYCTNTDGGDWSQPTEYCCRIRKGQFRIEDAVFEKLSLEPAAIGS